MYRCVFACPPADAASPIRPRARFCTGIEESGCRRSDTAWSIRLSRKNGLLYSVHFESRDDKPGIVEKDVMIDAILLYSEEWNRMTLSPPYFPQMLYWWIYFPRLLPLPTRYAGNATLEETASVPLCGRMPVVAVKRGR